MSGFLEDRPEEIKYLRLLAQKYPSIQSVSTEIINLNAILNLPKPTEHFLSDLHGEHEAFIHIMNNASGVIREYVDRVFSHSLSCRERAELATLIYYPERKLKLIKQRGDVDMEDFYRVTLHRLLEVCRLTASKYTRSRVRKMLPSDFEYIIDELLHTNYDVHNKERYYRQIIDTIIEIDRADAFISALCELIQGLAVDRLHIVGDIFDRGAHPEVILERLAHHHRVDIQWGNHDILWMGAAAGSEACILNVLNVSLLYGNLDVIENGYGINLRPLALFAEKAYANSPVDCFLPRGEAGGDSREDEVLARIHKAVVIMQFKAEGALIARNPDFGMDDRRMLDKIDYSASTICLAGKTYKLRDCDFPTIDPENPYRFTDDEHAVMESLTQSFTGSEKLCQHVKFLYSNGSIYLIYNSNLLFHGCIPLNDDHTPAEIFLDGKPRSGKKLMNRADKIARRAFFAPDNSAEKRFGQDFMWYLWCGKFSPLFGRCRMTTFERLLIEDRKTWTEKKNAYYDTYDDPALCESLLELFGLDPSRSHIINGHLPVMKKNGESPVKAGGRLIVIDGGFCRAYQSKTGNAGYTLIYNSHGMRIVSHEPFDSITAAISENRDIRSVSEIFESETVRLSIADTDNGRAIQEQVNELKLLLKAYRMGIITQ